MNPEEFELPGRPLTEAEREAYQKDGRLPQSFDPQPTTSEPAQEEQSSGFDLGSALNAAGTFLTENLNPTAGQSLEERETRLRKEIEQADKNNTDPVRNFTENLAVTAVDFIDNTFQGDQRTREEIAENRQKISLDNRTRMAAVNEEATSGSSVGGEAVRAVVGGVAESLEGILEGADFVGDMGLTALAATGLDFGLVQDKDLTWHEAYQAMDYDFGIAPNNTRTGAFARSTIGVLLNMRQLAMYGGGKLPILRAGMGPNSTRLSRLGGEALRGAIVDFFRNPDEGNIANMLGGDQENANILLKAIAHQDDDNQYTRRLKNAIEGGTIGLAADGLGELIGALRKGFKFRADPEKATTETLAEIKRGISARAGLLNNKPSQAQSAELFQQYQTQIEFAQKDLSLPENQDIYPWQIEQAQRQAEELKSKIPLQYLFDQGFDFVDRSVEMPNGTPMNFRFTKSEKILGGTVQPIDVSWDVKKGQELGKGSIRAIRGFNEMIQGLPPGTVLENSPLLDTKALDGEASVRRVEKAKADQDARFNQATFAWFKENFADIYGEQPKFPMKLGDGTTVKDFDAYWNDILDAEGRERMGDRFAATEQGDKVWDSIYNNDSTKPNTRAKIYQRVGFGAPDSYTGVQYGVLRSEPDAKGRWLEPVELTLKNENRAAEQQLLNDTIQRAKTFKGPLSEQETARLTEAKLNGGESGKFDPQERAQRTSRFDAEEVEFTQQTWTDPDGAPKPFLDDEDFRRLNTVEALQNFIREQDSSIDINEIATRLKREPVEYQLDTLRTVARMAFSGVSEEFIDQLRFSTRPDGSVMPESMFRRGVSSGGAVVLKVMSFDAARQMKDIAREILDLEGVDANFNTQALMVLDRAELLMRAKKEATSLSSDLLQQWGLKPRKQFDEIQENDLAIQEIFGKWKEVFRRGDIEEIREIQDDFMDFATQLMVTDGDPLRQLSFWAAWAKQGFRNFNQVIINGWLSTPVSQARNIVGGAATAIERPLALGIGSILHGDLKRAKAAFHMYDSMVHTIGESLRVAHKSITSGVAVTDATKFDFGLEDATRMEALAAKAKTPQQRFAMQMLNAYHGFAHSPWVTLPSRGLTAGDDFFKTLVTRQEMRYQAAMEASNFELDGKALKNPKEAREAIYQQMVGKYLGVNGEIINDKLRAIADEATFQTELQGRMKQFSELPDDFPEIKQFMPFIKTPHNLNVQAGMHIPGLARFLDEGKQIMKSGTPEEKAILRGKQALGVMTFALGANLAHQGLLTGFGPADPRLREVWLKTHQPQSIYIFGKWRSYKAIPVADLLFAAIADTAMIAKSVPESTQAQLTAQIVYTIASMATNRTYFDGLVELSGLLDFESYNYGQAVGDFVTDRLNAAAGMVGLRGALENQHKEGLTEYRTQLDAIMGKLSGGFMGERIETTDILTGQQQLSGFEDPLNFINPFRSMTPNADPLIAAFSDLRFGLPNSFVRRIDGLELTKDESEFIRQRMYSNGRLRNWLVDYLKSPEFEQKYENWRGALGTGEGVPRKESKWYRDMIKVFTESRRQAIQALREDRTNLGAGFNRRLEDHQLQQQGGSTPLRKSTREAIQQLSTVAN